MAKVHPQTNSDSSYTASTRETFTVWLKSLIFHGNGCTVFNSKGEILFRVDNYQQKCSNEVFIMDLNGDVVFSLQQEKIQFFGRWNGYKWRNSKVDEERPWIQIRKRCRVFGRKMICRAARAGVGFGAAAGVWYGLIRSNSKQEFKVVDNAGRLVAEAKRKQSSEGISYGDDVLTLIVEAHVDQLLIIALMTVYGLINRRL